MFGSPARRYPVCEPYGRLVRERESQNKRYFTHSVGFRKASNGFANVPPGVATGIPVIPNYSEF